MTAPNLSPGHDHGQGDGADGQHGEGGGGHAGHSHGVSADTDRRYLMGALALIVAFMAAEVAAGIVAHSLALISDTAHMLTDAGSIVLALAAIRLAARPPQGGYTFGLKRAEILSAQANGLTLLLLSAWLGYEAIRRLIAPPAVSGGLVLGTALAGVIVNLAAAWLMSKANRASLNIQGAYRHILTDLYAGVELELGLHHVAFGDPAGGAVGCADADNEPPAPGRHPAAPGVAVDRDGNLRALAGPQGGDDLGRDLDPGGIAGRFDRGRESHVLSSSAWPTRVMPGE